MTDISNLPIALFVMDEAGELTFSAPLVTEHRLDIAPLYTADIGIQNLLDQYRVLPDVHENCMRALNGEIFTAWSEVQGVVLETLYAPVNALGQRRLGRVVGVITTLTGQAQTAVALQESEQRFHDLFESSPDAIFVEDMQGYVLDVNPAACRLHGVERSDLIGKHVTELVPSDQTEAVRASFAQLARGEIDRAEGYSYTATGQSIPVEIKVNQMVYLGKPAVLLHVRDMTAWRIEQEARLRSEATVHALLNAMPDLLLQVHRDGTYRNVKQEQPSQIEIMLGGVYPLFMAEVMAQALTYLPRAFETSDIQIFECVFPQRLGEHLVAIGAINVDGLQSILEEQQYLYEHGNLIRLGDLLIEKELVSPSMLEIALEQQRLGGQSRPIMKYVWLSVVPMMC
ncbi:MAG: PAS domain S-box protein [Chloroflexaceae bacterium]|nr:PAS domain S-box protein [Chloroflexaceae bacterium]